MLVSVLGLDTVLEDVSGAACTIASLVPGFVLMIALLSGVVLITWLPLWPDCKSPNAIFFATQMLPDEIPIFFPFVH